MPSLFVSYSQRRRFRHQVLGSQASNVVQLSHFNDSPFVIALNNYSCDLEPHCVVALKNGPHDIGSVADFANIDVSGVRCQGSYPVLPTASPHFHNVVQGGGGYVCASTSATLLISSIVPILSRWTAPSPGPWGVT